MKCRDARFCLSANDIRIIFSNKSLKLSSKKYFSGSEINILPKQPAMLFNDELIETIPLLSDVLLNNNLITMLSPGDDDEIDDEDDDWTDIDDEDFEDMAEDQDDVAEMELENDIFDPEDDDHLPDDDF